MHLISGGGTSNRIMMNSKRYSIEYLPGARGHYLSMCINLLYNYDAENFVRSHEYILDDNGKVFADSRNIQCIETLVELLGNPIDSDFYIRGLLYDNYVVDDELKKYFKYTFNKYAHETNFDSNVIIYTGHESSTAKNTLYCESYIKSLYSLLDVDNVFLICPNTLEDFVEICVIQHLKDDLQEDINIHSIMSMIYSFLEMKKLHEKNGSILVDYDKIKNLSVPKLARYISSLTGIETTINNEFVKFVRDYKNIDDEVLKSIKPKVDKIVHDIIIYNENIDYKLSINTRHDYE